MEKKSIYLPHKRTLDIKDSPEFLKIRREINEELYATSEG
jgi:NitT/TauT family transport system ATP-binding protein